MKPDKITDSIMSTDEVIPIVNNKKYTTNSKGFLTGVLNLIIERAPTIPNDRAILEEIEEVIVKPIGASNKKFNSWFVDCTHSNFIKLNEI